MVAALISISVLTMLFFVMVKVFSNSTVLRSQVTKKEFAEIFLTKKALELQRLRFYKLINLISNQPVGDCNLSGSVVPGGDFFHTWKVASQSYEYCLKIHNDSKMINEKLGELKIIGTFRLRSRPNDQKAVITKIVSLRKGK